MFESTNVLSLVPLVARGFDPAAKMEPLIKERERRPPEDRRQMIDTPYDIEAAARAGVRAIAFRSGGWDDADLKGAVAIYDGAWDLLANLDSSPIGGG